MALSAPQADSLDSMMSTPMKSHFPVQATPKRSERKRALFPTASPQTSDLGHISPLGSSPDRYSSAPASPDSQSFSPAKLKSGPASPFGRKHKFLDFTQHSSPRTRLSELFENKRGTSNGQSSNFAGAPHSQHNQSSWSKDIVPADQLEQTVMSVMEDSDCADSPHSHASQHTPSSTPRGHKVCKAASDVERTHPLTPSKRRSRFIPISGSGSTTSTSPQSPKRQHRLSLEAKSKSAELPRARLSLFSEHSSIKRERKDGVYLTGRSSKTRKTFGQINAGVRTGIRRRPKSKPKKKYTKVKQPSLHKLRLTPEKVKLSVKELANSSASASMQAISRKRSLPKVEDDDKDEESMGELSPASSSKKRIFKSHPLKKKRVATITVNKNVRITLSNGKFTLNKGDNNPTPKRRRKLFDLTKQIEEINTFDDNLEDVADCARKDVQIILKRLEDDSLDTYHPSSNPLSSKVHLNQIVESSYPRDSVDKNNGSTVTSPPSPLSELASSTSTLSLNIGGDTLHLKDSQVQALSFVPDLIMEEDDDMTTTQSLEEVTDDTHNENGAQDTAISSDELKENGGCAANVQESPPVKYFPIFNGQALDDTPADTIPPNNIKKRKRPTWRPIGNDQYQIDAGQKRFGATQCPVCDMIYQLGDPEDEILHSEVHSSFKFLKHTGWRKENVVGEFGSDYVLVVKPGDPKLWWTKVLQVLSIVDKSLGFTNTNLDISKHTLTYLYISGKRIVGCLVAQPLKTAHRMLLSESETGGIDCCSKEEYPVKCGVSRIWVHAEYRRRHIASNLMDCMRKSFLFGGFLTLEDIAFSSPTSAGKLFAEKYTGRKNYFLYL